jgi:seryl-tRNA synthetase
MLSLDFIRENLELVKKNSQQRGADFDVDIFLKNDQKRKETIVSLDELRQKRNELAKSKEITPAIISEGKKIKQEIKDLEEKLKESENELNKLVWCLPNITLSSVPVGKNEEDNVVMKEVGQKRSFSFEPKSYLEIGENLNLIDISRATKVAGSRFAVLKNELALIQFALLDLVLEVTKDFNFQFVIPPTMINPEWMERLGYLDLEESNIYLIEKDNLNLVGTAEHSLASMHQGEIIESLPLRYLGYSSCFRREAGTYGRDLKGILRLHQFDKAELFSFCSPEDSEKEHRLFVEIAEKLVGALGLPYRVMALSSGDLGKPSASTIDIETWFPFEKKYRETHSASNCTDYQSRGMDIRYRQQSGKSDYVHTVNGTALAMGRILASIIENYQEKDGSVEVPKVLRKRLGFKRISR